MPTDLKKRQFYDTHYTIEAKIRESHEFLHNARTMHPTMNTMCRRLFHKPAHAVSVTAVVLVLLSGSFVRANASDDLASLNEAQQDAVMRLCTPSQFLEGPQAFRDCLLQKVDEVQNNTDVQFSALSGLALDEQHVIQRFCSPSESSLSSPTYLKCAGTQLLQLEDEPQPDLADIAEHEQYAITQQCFDSASPVGARDYRVCVNNAIETLETLPAAVFTDQSITARNNIELECSRNTSNVSNYRQCLLDTLGIEFTTEQDTSARELVDTDSPPSLESPESPEPSEAQEQPGNTSEPIASESLDAVSPNDTTEPTTAFVDPIATPDKMRSTYWIAAVAALAIALMIMGLWFRRRLAKGRSMSQLITSSSSGEPFKHDPEKNSPIRPDLKPFANDTVNHSDNVVDLELVRQTQGTAKTPDLGSPDLVTIDPRTSDFATPDPGTPDLASPGTPDLATPDPGTPDLATPDPGTPHLATPDPGAHDLATPDPNTPHLATPDPGTPDLATPDPNTPDLATPDLSPPDLKTLVQEESTQSEPDTHEPIENTIPLPRPLPRDRGRFAAWLGTLPEDLQQENAIGLLVYWIAYADDRYDPALKKRIFQLQDPDDKDLIKRWAFKKDAVAFVDAIQYLQSHTYAQQREQIVSLLLALLVDERALTPIQNILLRFIADSFGILKASLSRMFNQAYGGIMPAIPRPDKVIWWEKVDTEQKLRWDARALLSESDQIRYRVLLGQPLYEKLDLESVAASYQRAIKRCELKQASELGDWERSLLDLKRARFEVARKFLMDSAT